MIKRIIQLIVIPTAAAVITVLSGVHPIHNMGLYLLINVPICLICVISAL